MEPDWSDFRILLALSRGGSVAGAARALGVDNSTVSRRLGALEEAVGARLILRGGREFTWTAEGRSAVAAAEAMEAAVSCAVRALRSARLATEGSVRVSCPPAFAPTLMHVFATLQQQHPRLEVELSGDYRTVDLARGEADVALRMACPTEPGLVARRAVECGWALYASQGYAAARGLPATNAELQQHRLVLYVEAMHRIAPLRWLEGHRGPATAIVRVDSLEVLANVVASDGGIGALPCFVGDAHPGFVRVLPQPVAFNTGYLVVHESARDTARVRVAVDALREHFEANAGSYLGR